MVRLAPFCIEFECNLSIQLLPYFLVWFRNFFVNPRFALVRKLERGTDAVFFEIGGSIYANPPHVHTRCCGKKSILVAKRNMCKTVRLFPFGTELCQNLGCGKS